MDDYDLLNQMADPMELMSQPLPEICKQKPPVSHAGTAAVSLARPPPPGHRPTQNRPYGRIGGGTSNYRTTRATGANGSSVATSSCAPGAAYSPGASGVVANAENGCTGVYGTFTHQRTNTAAGGANIGAVARTDDGSAGTEPSHTEAQCRVPRTSSRAAARHSGELEVDLPMAKPNPDDSEDSIYSTSDSEAAENFTVKACVHEVAESLSERSERNATKVRLAAEQLHEHLTLLIESTEEEQGRQDDTEAIKRAQRWRMTRQVLKLSAVTFAITLPLTYFAAKMLLK